MIGYYVHHQGSGHLHRALAVDQAFHRAGGEPLTGLSTHPRPQGWRGDWVQLPDDAGAPANSDRTAHGQLHYAPLGWTGLADRMGLIGGWLTEAAPSALVVDVSVEVALLARLYGTSVVTVAQPGLRTDSPHRLGYDIAAAIVAPWCAPFGALWAGSKRDLGKTHFVGPVTRLPIGPGPVRPRRVVVLNGTGGDGATAVDVAAASAAAPDWEWVHLDRTHGRWVADPHDLLQSAEVIVAHAGQNAIAEIAAVRRPAVLIPQDRPFAEQRTTASALAANGLPVQVLDGWPAADRWPELLRRVARLDGADWHRWNDGGGAARMAAVLEGFEGRSSATSEAAAVPA